MRSFTALLLVSLLALGLAAPACNGPAYSTCLDETSSTATGTFSLVASADASSSGRDEGGALSFTMDNFDPFTLGCDGGEAFLLHDETCSFHAVVVQTSHDTGRYSSRELIEATATIVPDAAFTCTVPTGSGTVSLVASSGNLDVTSGQMTLDVAGVDGDGNAVAFHFAGVWQGDVSP